MTCVHQSPPIRGQVYTSLLVCVKREVVGVASPITYWGDDSSPIWEISRTRGNLWIKKSLNDNEINASKGKWMPCWSAQSGGGLSGFTSVPPATRFFCDEYQSMCFVSTPSSCCSFFLAIECYWMSIFFFF